MAVFSPASRSMAWSSSSVMPSPFCNQLRDNPKRSCWTWGQTLHSRAAEGWEDHGSTPLKILGLAGEYRATSKSGMLVNAALAHAEAQGQGVFWDSRKTLPLVGEDGCWSHPSVKEFRASLKIVTPFPFLPEYHGTMSGVMKNTMDWMYDKHVGGKVFGQCLHSVVRRMPAPESLCNRLAMAPRLAGARANRRGSC